MCTSPIYLTVKGRPNVPCSCGKCGECVSKRQNGISIRGAQEMKRWKTVLFVTLTFNNENMPTAKLGDLLEQSITRDILRYDKKIYRKTGEFPNDYPARLFDTGRKVEVLKSRLLERPQARYPQFLGDAYSYMHADRLSQDSTIGILSVEEWRKFMKRFRENLVNLVYPRVWSSQRKKMVRSLPARIARKRCAIKYIFTGEYGPNTLRPHYHMIVYSNVAYHFIRSALNTSWTLGFVDVDRVNPLQSGDNTQAAISYIAKYLYKPEWFENPYITSGILPRCHRGQSHGIGENYVEDVLIPNLKQIDHLFGENKYGDYYGFNKSYIGSIHDKFRVYSGGYMYALPRYYKDKILPKKFVRSEVMDYKTREIHYVQGWRVDGDAPLSLALSFYVFDRIEETMEADIAAIQSCHPEAAFNDVLAIYRDNVEADLRMRDARKTTALHNAYWRKCREYIQL